MKIAGISLFNVELPPKGGYSRARLSTIVRVDTDEGVSGFGEVVSYTPGFTEASRAGLVQRGADLIGEDPFHIHRLNRMMDVLFKHDSFDNEVKVAIDIALWDVIGHATGRPVSDLLGGSQDAPVPLYEAVYFESGDTPEELADRAAQYRQRGYRHLMVKTGRDPAVAIERIEAACSAMQSGDTVIADAGGSWSLYEAIRIGRALDKPSPVILVVEQPCATLEECVAFREHCHLPVKLDELVDSTYSVLQIQRANAAEICNLQIARIGSLTKSRYLRDLCIELGLTVVTQDRHGSAIVGAAVAHFAQSTDPAYLMNTFHFPSLVDVITADGCPAPENGFLTASSAPGLGITPNADVLGEPLAVLGTPILVG